MDTPELEKFLEFHRKYCAVDKINDMPCTCGRDKAWEEYYILKRISEQTAVVTISTPGLVIFKEKK